MGEALGIAFGVAFGLVFGVGLGFLALALTVMVVDAFVSSPRAGYRPTRTETPKVPPAGPSPGLPLGNRARPEGRSA